MVANKHPGIRAGIAWKPEIAHAIREHNNANILCLPARHLTLDQVIKIVDIWMMSSFSTEPRHSRRVGKIAIQPRLRATLDKVREHTIAVTEHGMKAGLLPLLRDGARVSATPILKHLGGRIEREGDLVEITLKHPTTITIGNIDYAMQPGKSWFPLVCMNYDELKVKGPCLIQYYFLDTKERAAIMVFSKDQNVCVSHQFGRYSIFIQQGWVTDTVSDVTADWPQTQKELLVSLGLLEPN